MAQFCCTACDHEGHFTEFKVGTHMEPSDDEDHDEEVEVDDLECPECGSGSVVEL